MTKEEGKEDPSELIYDLPKCFMMTWEELMDRTSTTTIGYDIWNEEVPETKNYSTSTNGGRLQTLIKLSNTHKCGKTL